MFGWRAESERRTQKPDRQADPPARPPVNEVVAFDDHEHWVEDEDYLTAERPQIVGDTGGFCLCL